MPGFFWEIALVWFFARFAVNHPVFEQAGQIVSLAFVTGAAAGQVVRFVRVCGEAGIQQALQLVRGAFPFRQADVSMQAQL